MTRRKRRREKPIDWTELERLTRIEFEKNAARVNAGETFRSQARAGRSPSPSKTDGQRNG